MPDWDDYIDPNFDFEKDEFSANNKAERNDIYIYELMGDASPCNGILVSLAQLIKKKGALKNHDTSNENPVTVREIMRIPKRLIVMGDCGAFTYKGNDEPAFTPEEAAKIYETLGFDIGASVDHMIVAEKETVDEKGNKKKVPLTEEELRKRIDITNKNAEKFIKEVRERNYKFTPMGTIQGITKEDYAEAFKKYVQLGYEHIALGSLVPKKDEEILEIIKAIGKEYKKLPAKKKEKISIHLFGVLRPKLYKYYKENGITSFDSISFFRKAWLRSSKNYLGVNGEWYAALRVPQSTLPQNIKKIKKKKISLVKVANLEKRVLETLSKYDKHQISLEETLKLLIKYDKLFERSSEDGDRIRDAYERTLRDRPWETCDCPICKEIGIHVVIFRGSNRNKRRGFHNTIVFYNDLMKIRL
jgi:queuine/archaeosine tRNA-ribosyltransferase